MLLNVSPKQLSPTTEVGPPNVNVTFANNIVTLAPPGGATGSGPRTLMVEARLLTATLPTKALPYNLPAGTCTARRLSAATEAQDEDGNQLQQQGPGLAQLSARQRRQAMMQQQQHADQRLEGPRRQLQQSGGSFVWNFVNAPGEQGRNADGSCPLFPDSHPWHMDVRQLPVDPRSETIKRHIGGGNVRPDWGGGELVNGQRVLYGIPFITVDSARGTSMVQVCARVVLSTRIVMVRTFGYNLASQRPVLGNAPSALPALCCSCLLHTGSKRRVAGAYPTTVTPHAHSCITHRSPSAQVTIGPDGYEDESDLSPNAFPIPPSAPIEGAYPGCPADYCDGDRHVIVLDNATCMLYEAYRRYVPRMLVRTDARVRERLVASGRSNTLSTRTAKAEHKPILILRNHCSA